MTITEELRQRLLKSIELSGSTIDDVASKQLINVNPDNVIDLSSGRPRIKPLLVGRFVFVSSQPTELAELSNLTIRCLNCGKVISYPAWWLKLEYSVSSFHYFICFNGTALPNLKCIESHSHRMSK